MTIEEAKNFIATKNKCHKADDSYCGKYEVCFGCPYDYDASLISEAYDVALMSLEKQIPKKPIFVYFEFDKSTCAYCPNCYYCFGETKPTMCMNTRTMKMLMRSEKMCSCEKCGQRIDFTEEGVEE